LILSGAFYPDLKAGVWGAVERINFLTKDGLFGLTDNFFFHIFNPSKNEFLSLIYHFIISYHSFYHFIVISFPCHWHDYWIRVGGM